MLQAKKTTLVEPISDTHDKSYADIPDGKRARDHGYEPLALVLAYIAGAPRASYAPVTARSAHLHRLARDCAARAAAATDAVTRARFEQEDYRRARTKISTQATAPQPPRMITSGTSDEDPPTAWWAIPSKPPTKKNINIFSAATGDTLCFP
jgi:hypothetical protein